MSIVFPCPHCGASQNVNDTDTATQCQFCGNNISVPEELRPKAAAPDPAAAMPQSFSFSGAAAMPGMAGMPGMFLNMDIGKLRAMAMAARAGDKAEAARLYVENFGVSPEEAMQAAELMSSHHHIVLGQMQMGNAPVIHLGGLPASAPISSPTPIYNLPSPPVPGGNPSTRGRWAACLAVAFVLLIAVIIGGTVIVMAVARAR
jgi:hypothetical protein